MSLNPLKWIEWLINEHGTSTIRAERLAFAQDRIVQLEKENAALKQENAVLKTELKTHQTQRQQDQEAIRDLEAKCEIMQRALSDANGFSGAGGAW